MDLVLEFLMTIWGRISYLGGVPLQMFGEWAWRNPAYYLLSPEISLLAGVLVICLVEVFSKRDNFLLAAWIAIISLLGNFVMTLHMMQYTSRYFSYGLGNWWGGLETIDPYALLFKQLMDWGDILLILGLICYPLLKKYRVEFIVLLLSGTIAYDLMVGSSDLLAVYVMMEFGGICGYIMAAYYKTNLRSLEAGLKYFITGAASSATLLFAMSILYGALNTTNFYDLKDKITAGGADLPPVVFSVVLILVAMGYKVGLAPFHLWVADVYEGAPTPVTAFISVFPKMAGFAVLLRLLFIPFISLREIWIPLLITMAIASMIIGNVMALRQTSFKRMMAFSGISHMGYIMIGIVAAAYAGQGGNESMGFYSAMYYVVVYFFMNLGIFLVAMAIETYGGSDHLDSYNGLVRRNPTMAVLVTILLMGLVGLPPTVGFWSKFFVFSSITYYYGVPYNLIMVVFAVITTVIGAYYYMKLAYRIWALPPLFNQTRRFQPALFIRLAILIPTVLVFMLGWIYVDAPFNYVKGAFFMTWKVAEGSI